MKTFIHLLIISFFIVSCKKNSDSSYENGNISEIDTEEVTDDNDFQTYYSQTGEYPDGTYCSEIEYYNPSTGTRSTYDLDVEVEDGELTVIHWPNGGWLDETHFSPEDISDGECEFKSDRGYRYTVTLQQFGGCGYTDDYKIRNDVNDEVEKTTCTKCGNEKERYDEYCYSCKRKIEETCPKCGGYKFSSFDEYCDDCKNEKEDEDEE